MLSLPGVRLPQPLSIMRRPLRTVYVEKVPGSSQTKIFGPHLTLPKHQMVHCEPFCTNSLCPHLPQTPAGELFLPDSTCEKILGPPYTPPLVPYPRNQTPLHQPSATSRQSQRLQQNPRTFTSTLQFCQLGQETNSPELTPLPIPASLLATVSACCCNPWAFRQ